MLNIDRMCILLSGLEVAREYGLEKVCRGILTELKELLKPEEFKQLVETMFPGNWLLGGGSAFLDLIE